MKTSYLIFVLTILGIQLSAYGEAPEVIADNNSIIRSEIESDNISSATFTQHISEIPIEELSEKEIEGIFFMREEEKLARDIYLKLYEQWSLMPFRNISKSEQVHMDAILSLINKYNLDDPAEGNEIGIFKNEELQKLYNQLIERGLKSVTESLKVGALIEEVDIIDLQKIIDEDVDNEDIEFVFNNLKRASGFHLRAFVRNLIRYNITYEPVLLDVNIFDEIIQ